MIEGDVPCAITRTIPVRIRTRDSYLALIWELSLVYVYLYSCWIAAAADKRRFETHTLCLPSCDPEVVAQF